MSALSAHDALALMRALCALSLVVQTLEFLRLRAPLGPEGVWSFAVQQGDLAHARAPVRALFMVLSRPPVHAAHLVLRLVAALLLPFGFGLPLSLFLFLGTLAILIRWRGAFNGGSDFMTVVVTTALVIADAGALLGRAEAGAAAALWYAAVQAISSYFVSGAVKLLDADWRSGRALPIFLDGGVHGPLAPDSIFRGRSVSLACTWGFILWECAFPLALLAPAIAAAFCAGALLFHLLVFRFFGLNRFVFAWAATFPAVVYAAGSF